MVELVTDEVVRLKSGSGLLVRSSTNNNKKHTKTMSIKEPPQILRVKRRRTEDPLQALVMETNRRKIKRPRYVFRLKRTEEKDIQDSTAVLTASKDRKNDKPVFNIPSKKENVEKVGASAAREGESGSEAGSVSGAGVQDGTATTKEQHTKEGPMELNSELLEMLNDYLKNNDETTINNPVKPPKRRQSSVSQELNANVPKFSREDMLKGCNGEAIDERDNEDDDEDEYVYDVYYRDKAVSDQWENERIGYIKFDDDELDKLEDKEDDTLLNTDDEDSNDENFYRNDYPEDEDGGYEDESELESMGLDEPSDDQDDEFMILNNKRRFSRSEFLNSEGLKRASSDEYHRLAEQIDEQPILWGQPEDGADYTDDIEMGENDTDGEINFQRQTFFPTDKDDPAAIHRDRIFGKLQQMIEEQQRQ